MRLGAQDCLLTPGSLAARIYDETKISERHRHRYEFNPLYRQQFEDAGLKPTGYSPDGGLAEIIEITDHPWFLAVQFHPEFKSKPPAPHPLFASFIAAAMEQSRLV